MCRHRFKLDRQNQWFCILCLTLRDEGGAMHVLMAVVDMQPEELAVALINKAFTSLPTDALRQLVDKAEFELLNRLAQEAGYVSEENHAYPN